MTKRIRVILLVAATAIALTALPSTGTRDMSRKERKSCVTCHVKMGSKELNDAGKYYKEKGTLEGFEKKKKTEAGGGLSLTRSGN